MKTLTINVEGWPDDLVRLIQTYAKQLEDEVRRNGRQASPEPLPVWPGVAAPPEQLRRRELYRDVD